MAKTKRLVKSIFRLFLPIVLLLLIAAAAASVWLVHEASHPVGTGYLVTPEKYGMLSSRGAQVTEESWQGRDGGTQKGWLLRGSPNLPAVILLHKYGANRSHVLNLGVKLNEATNFTVLMPDLRGQGNEPGDQRCSFGGCEADDLASTVVYLKGLKTPAYSTFDGRRKPGYQSCRSRLGPCRFGRSSCFCDSKTFPFCKQFYRETRPVGYLCLFF